MSGLEYVDEYFFNTAELYLEGFSINQIKEKMIKEKTGIRPTKKDLSKHLRKNGVKIRSTSEAITEWTKKIGGPWNKGLDKNNHPSIMKYANSRKGKNNPYYLMSEETRKKTKYWEYKTDEELKKIRASCGDTLRKKYRSGELVYYGKINPEWAERTCKKRMEGYRRWVEQNIDNVNLPVSKKERQIGEFLTSLGKVFSKQFRIAGAAYRYDFMLKEEKLIIEFNGTYWHCDPRRYSDGFYHTKKEKTAAEIWEHDADKKHHAVENGYEYLVIWEEDVRRKTISEFKEYFKKILETKIEKVKEGNETLKNNLD
jgi:G:T-mismatch repair DNA endonuclease (very short patch repair protein)